MYRVVIHLHLIITWPDVIVCEYYHILVHIFLHIQVPHALLECWCPAVSNDIQLNALAPSIDAVPAQFISTHILISKEFVISHQNDFHSKPQSCSNFNIVNGHTTVRRSVG